MTPAPGANRPARASAITTRFVVNLPLTEVFPRPWQVSQSQAAKHATGIVRPIRVASCRAQAGADLGMDGAGSGQGRDAGAGGRGLNVAGSGQGRDAGAGGRGLNVAGADSMSRARTQCRVRGPARGTSRQCTSPDRLPIQGPAASAFVDLRGRREPVDRVGSHSSEYLDTDRSGLDHLDEHDAQDRRSGNRVRTWISSYSTMPWATPTSSGSEALPFTHQLSAAPGPSLPGTSRGATRR